MASSPETAMSSSTPQPASASSSTSASQSINGLPQGQGQQQRAPPKAGDRQPQHQQHGGHPTEHLLQGVAATSDLLKGCIRAREKLGAAKMAIMRAREEDARKPARPTRPMMVLHGGTWEETAGAPDWGEWPAVDAGGGGEKVAAAMEAALPLAEEFSEKMSELAEVVPELSRTLVSLTEVTTAAATRARADGPGTPSSARGQGGQGMPASDPAPLSSECESLDYDYVQELIKVAPPALARLLSFEHLRASEVTARDLVQALVNLYVGVGSGLGGATSQASRGGTVNASLGSSSPTAATAVEGTTPRHADAESGACGSQKTPGSGGTSSRVSPPSGSSTGSRVSVGMSAATGAAGAVTSSFLSSSSAGRGHSGGISISASVDSSRGGGGGGGSTGTTMSRSEAQRLEKLGKKTASWVVGILKQALGPKVYGGKLMRSKGIEGLLGRHGVGAVQHSRAVQEELLMNAEVVQGLAADDLASARSKRPPNQPSNHQDENNKNNNTTGNSSYSSSFVADSRSCQTDAESTIPGSNCLQQQQQQQSGRKRSRPLSSLSPAASPATGEETRTDPLRVYNTLHCGSPGHRYHAPPCCQPGWGNDRAVLGRGIGGGGGGDVSRLFGGALGLEMVEGGGAVAAAKGPEEILLENTVKAFSSMLETGDGGGDGAPPTQLLRARLQQVAYRLLAAPSHADAGGRDASDEAAFDSPVPPLNAKDKDGQSGVSPSSPSPPADALLALLSRREGVSGHSRKADARPPKTKTTTPRRSRTPASASLSPSPSPSPGCGPSPGMPANHHHHHHHHHRLPVPAAEWESRVRDCLSKLEQRPLLCPDALLRDTGAKPSLPPESCVRGSTAVAVAGGGIAGTGGGDAVAAGGGGASSGDGGGGSSNGRGCGSGFPLPEAHLLVGLSLVEEAVLEEDRGGGGGEAAAGLLRAFHTVRNTSNTCGLGRGRGGSGVGGVGGGVNSGDGDEALAGGGRGHTEGGGVSAFAALLDQAPSGCVKKTLDALMRTLESGSVVLGGRYGREDGDKSGVGDAIVGAAHHRRHPQALSGGIHGTPLGERPFEVELWLVLLGYRHWILVALVYLVSADACASCAPCGQEEAAGASTSGRSSGDADQRQLQRQASAVSLLAWYACGGTSLASTPPNGELREAEESVRRMAACLAECTQGDNSIASPPGDELPPPAEKAATPESHSQSQSQPETRRASAPVTAVTASTAVLALETAGRAGKGLMGAIFSPFLAVAWLLSSRLALSHCESVLSGSVLREDDLDVVLREHDLDSDVAFERRATAGARADREASRRRASLDRVLQGLAALEDLAWLCGLNPPISSHVHEGQDLKVLLTRTRAWLSGVARSRRSSCGHPHLQQGRRQQGGGRVGDVHDHGDGDDGDEAYGTEWVFDFAARGGAISSQLGWLLARL